MNKKQSRTALELYKKFLIRMDRVAEFLRVAEARALLLHLLRALRAARELLPLRVARRRSAWIAARFQT